MNYFWAFCVGGAICVAGQLLIDLTGLTCLLYTSDAADE